MTVRNLKMDARSNEFNSLMTNSVFTNLNGEMENSEECIDYMVKLFNRNKEEGNAIYIIGNGGSAAVASHALTDFVNACHLRAFTLNEPSLITCMANDFGYVESYKLILQSVFKKNDILIAISSSGNSPNMHHAVETAKKMGGIVITMSGFKPENKLRTLGYLNLWLDSCDYGLVEIGHLFALHNIADRIATTVDKGVKLEYFAV